MKKGRIFVAEGECKELRYAKNKVQKGYFFLFNDILILATPKSNKFKVLEELQLENDTNVEETPADVKCKLIISVVIKIY